MQKSVFFLTAFTALSSVSAAEIHIAEQIPYQDESRINHRITSECTDIGRILSESVVKHAAGHNITVIRSPNPENHNVYAKIEIDSAISAGTAMIGHWKGISLQSTLYRNGSEADRTTLKRNSTGGMFGGFKSSCSVLYRTANVLGKDIAGWLAAQSKQ